MVELDVPAMVHGQFLLSPGPQPERGTLHQRGHDDVHLRLEDCLLFGAARVPLQYGIAGVYGLQFRRVMLTEARTATAISNWPPALLLPVEQYPRRLPQVADYLETVRKIERRLQHHFPVDAEYNVNPTTHLPTDYAAYGFDNIVTVADWTNPHAKDGGGDKNRKIGEGHHIHAIDPKGTSGPRISGVLGRF